MTSLALVGACTLLALLAGAAVVAFVPGVRVLARRLGAVDEPGGRRAHRGRIPRLGGVAVGGGVAIALVAGAGLGVPVLTLPADQGWRLDWLAVASLVIAAVGVADDVVGLRVSQKLAGQLAAAALAVGAGFAVRLVTHPLTGDTLDLGLVGLMVSLVWIVGVTNAVNLIDGLDGLASGVACIACLTLVVISLLEARTGAALLGACLAGALVGFLVFNLPPASIFLGDSGSLLVGFWLSVLSLQALQKTSTMVLIVASLLALGLPLADTMLAIVRRATAAGPAAVFRPDREHIHHRLLRTGRSPRAVLAVLYAACAAGGVLAFVAVMLRGPLNAVVVALAAVATWMAVRRLGRRLERSAAAPSDDASRFEETPRDDTQH
jgi:UDP-GlcNAc:undecaprenyl-phosphate GlcNAc-1-phosphate transferase